MPTAHTAKAWGPKNFLHAPYPGWQCSEALVARATQGDLCTRSICARSCRDISGPVGHAGPSSAGPWLCPRPPGSPALWLNTLLGVFLAQSSLEETVLEVRSRAGSKGWFSNSGKPGWPPGQTFSSHSPPGLSESSSLLSRAAHCPPHLLRLSVLL